jgi:hypothetical protein
LSLALGKTVRELLASIDSAELTEWLAYDRIEPFGEERADLRTGMVCSTVANHSFAPPRDPRKPADYMLFAQRADAAPIALADPKAQSDLIRAAVFRVGA